MTQRIDLPGLLFPRRCPVCHEVVEERGELACDICRTRLTYVRGNYCQKCGKPLFTEEREYCADCARRPHQFDRGRAAFAYDGYMRRSIARYKYGGRREYADFYAEEILRGCAKDALRWRAQALVPIPLHPSRRRRRGYNQAELLARALSVRCGIPVETGLLLRTRKTRAQKELGDQERAANLRGASSLRPGAVFFFIVIVYNVCLTKTGQ
ncbi:MAG: double zinc ribbon domain-containing protein, partial [Lachnospiraceae bacterium]|nr:double zinc ribbon domain-containing protein [Lachnospiraceae bacterium]